MARKLGYGGFANTNGVRDFSGKAGAVVVTVTMAFITAHLRTSASQTAKLTTAADQAACITTDADQTAEITTP